MNTLGNRLKITIFGTSHGESLGVVMDGVPAGMEISAEDFMEDIARRASGAAGTTPRKEADKPEIMSGVFLGRTTGSSLVIAFRNLNIRDEDYTQFEALPRPGHADYAAFVKYDGHNDPRGGGAFSGRMTLPIVAAGVVAKKMLAGTGMHFESRLLEVGGVSDSSKWPELLAKTAEEGDSLGGLIECTVTGVPMGLGEPFFDSVESLISHAIFSIPGVRGIEFGDGFASAAMKGSEHNDPWTESGRPAKNGAGGINGGISNGAPIVFRVAFKPTASIAMAQKTFNFLTQRMDTLRVTGRHDVCYALRTPVIVEAMAAIVLADLSI